MFRRFEQFDFCKEGLKNMFFDFPRKMFETIWNFDFSINEKFEKFVLLKSMTSLKVCFEKVWKTV